MKKNFAIVAAAAMAVAGLNLRTSAEDAPADAAHRAAQSAQDAGNQGGQAAQRAGERISEAARDAGNPAERSRQDLRRELPPAAARVDETAKADEVEKQITQAADAAVQPGKLNDAVQSLAQEDRHRVGEIKNDQANDYNQVLNRLRDDYKNKYGQDLSLSSANLFQNAQTVVATVVDPAPIPQWPLAGANEQAADQAQTAGERLASQAGAAINSSTLNQGAPTGQANGNAVTPTAASRAGQTLRQGQQIAVVRLPAEGMHPDLTVSTVQEDGQWKLVVPASIDSQSLTRNLTQQLQRVEDAKDRWPADAGQAQQHIARHVLQAFYDVKPRMHGEDRALPAGQISNPADGTTSQQPAAAPK